MIGRLAKWVHDLEPTNLCVVLERISEPEKNPEPGTADEDILFLLYDFITNEQFYALESEIHFIQGAQWFRQGRHDGQVQVGLNSLNRLKNNNCK